MNSWQSPNIYDRVQPVCETHMQIYDTVCLECGFDTFFCCSQCIAQHHAEHRTIPLSNLLEHSLNKTYYLQPVESQIPYRFNLQQQNTTRLLNNLRDYIMECLAEIEQQVTKCYQKGRQKWETSDMYDNGKNEILSYIHQVCESIDFDESKKALLNLVQLQNTGMIHSQRQAISFTQRGVDFVCYGAYSIIKQVEEKIRESMEQACLLAKGLSKRISNASAFKFSPELKHKDLSLVGSARVEVEHEGTGMLALMEPIISEATAFTFDISQLKGQVGIGVCLPCVKDQDFLCSDGKSVYMMTSNPSDACQWRVDAGLVHVQVSFATHNITFTQHNHEYKIPFLGDQLHPCVCLNKVGDSVRFYS